MSYFLREICRSDIQVINSWRNDRKIIDVLGASFRYIGEETDFNWFNNYLLNRLGTIRLAICNEVSTTLIGSVYLLKIDWVNRSAEFAIWIGEKSNQGKGAGFFAITETLIHAFNDLNLNRIYLTVLATNHRAINLYKKIGFLDDGRLRQAVFKNGCFVDMLQMSILSSEFSKK